MSIMVRVGRGAQAGVLVRDAAALERMERVDTLVLDKTGTLTAGRPDVVAVVPAGGMDRDALLALAAALERPSQHPLAEAVVRRRRPQPGPAAGRRFRRAAPARGHRHGGRAPRGDRQCPADGRSCRPRRRAGARSRPPAEGATVFFVAADGAPAGLIAVADPVKPGAAAALAALAADGLCIVMLTGDNRATAAAVAKGLGIAEVEADMLPEDKQRVVERLRAEGRRVAMAGTGSTTPPALAAADVGIAMGPAPAWRSKARASPCSAATWPASCGAASVPGGDAQHPADLFFAFAYNAAGVPIAAGVRTPCWACCCPPPWPPPRWRCPRSAWSATRCGCGGCVRG